MLAEYSRSDEDNNDPGEELLTFQLEETSPASREEDSRELLGKFPPTNTIREFEASRRKPSCSAKTVVFVSKKHPALQSICRFEP